MMDLQFTYDNHAAGQDVCDINLLYWGFQNGHYKPEKFFTTSAQLRQFLELAAPHVKAAEHEKVNEILRFEPREYVARS